MDFTVEEKVELVLYFYKPLSMDYEGWREESCYRRFEKAGYAKKVGDKIELTIEGREYLHNFIVDETEKVIKLIKKFGGKISPEELLKQLDYRIDAEEFLDYLLTNESKKENSRTSPLGSAELKYGWPPKVELLKKQ